MHQRADMTPEPTRIAVAEEVVEEAEQPEPDDRDQHEHAREPGTVSSPTPSAPRAARAPSTASTVNMSTSPAAVGKRRPR